jgi:exopolyphosphatase / guanosine-5'-triphosphate,3'-diphosphate pyrophosphatase
MTAPPSGRVAAFFDLGTNSIRLLVARFDAARTYTVLTKQKEVVRLGEGEFIRGWLRDDAMDRAVLVCRRFADLARSFGAEEYVAVATSATREARNCAEFLERLKNEAGLDVRMIPGNEEARLIYLGVSRGVDMGEAVALFVDIGGGSTEIILGDRHREHLLESLKLGAIRLTNRFFEEGAADPVPPKVYENICRYVRDTVSDTAERVGGRHGGIAYGSSGTIQNLADIARRHLHNRTAETSPVLSRDELGKTAAMLCSLPLDQRKRTPGINPERADIIIAGAAILEGIMDEFKLAEIRISDRGLRDGLLVDYLSRMEEFSPAEQGTIRRQSIQRLAGVCRAASGHAQAVTRLSLELFDTAGSTGLHSLGPAERELLEYAAYLHDIGELISFSNHHLHSHYIIRNADLPGFDRREVDIIAEVARHHRKKPPRKKSADAALPDPGLWEVVSVLSSFLRLAEHLDRSHAGLVDHARIVPADTGEIVLELLSAADCTLELSAVQSDARAFKKIFGRDLTIRCLRAE